MKFPLRKIMRSANRLTRKVQSTAASYFLAQTLAYVSARKRVRAGTRNRVPSAARRFPKLPVIPAIPAMVPSISAETKPRSGRFIHGSYSHEGKVHAFKLFIPPGARKNLAMPLVVMLHGCMQDPDDFANGTAMNVLALEQRFYVLYPEQHRSGNPARCWNWFAPRAGLRGNPDAEMIAAMSVSIVQEYAIDPERVFIAGLSAGGAMATQVAVAFPGIFSGVGVHSGMPPDAARSLREGIAAMRKGAVERNSGRTHSQGLPYRTSGSRNQELRVPTIVFHGDQDDIVNPRNGELVIAAVASSEIRHAEFAANPAIVERGSTAQGLQFTRKMYGAIGKPCIAEHWLVHGAGHAWSGGRSAGSFTEPNGPDASREMVRFFFSQARCHG